MNNIPNPAGLPERLRLDPDLLTIFTRLAEKNEYDRRKILRPHEDFGFSGDDRDSIDLRRRLDDGLDGLTKLEIACQLGLYGLNDTNVANYLKARVPGWSILIDSPAFLRYLGAYLYFGVRILTGRTNPPPWWFKADKEPLDWEKDEPFVNQRLLQLAVPPVAGNADANEQWLNRFLDLRAVTDQSCSDTLNFLDGFFESPQDGSFDYKEPAEFELWLRRLRPGTARFTSIKLGLVTWARLRADFYMSLEPDNEAQRWFAPREGERRRPKGGWAITNPVAARIALSDYYWLARVLRAEVAANGQVSYPVPSWLHVLRFEAQLDKNVAQTTALRDYEEVLRSVFDYVCDLVLNAVELAEDRARKQFAPGQYPKPPSQVKHWREIFDQELSEVEHQKDWREYQQPQPPAPAVSAPGWSQRLWQKRDTRHRIGLAFSGGGIRSATFNLGVLQGLQEFDLLRHVDYLSTVSGGGFIGSWLVGNAHRSRHWLGHQTPWDESIAHLRSYSNYLAPLTGILSPDSWTLGVSWVRNAFLVQLSGLTWIFALLAGTLLILRGFLFASGFRDPIAVTAGLAGLVVTCSLVYNFTGNKSETGQHAPSSGWVQWLTVVPSWVGAFFLASMLWSPWFGPMHVTFPFWGAMLAEFPNFFDYSQIFERVYYYLPGLFIFNLIALALVGWVALTPTKAKPIQRWNALLQALGMSLICTFVLYLEICGVVYLLLRLGNDRTHFGPYAFVFGPSFVLLSFTISVVIWIGLAGKWTNDAQREWWTRFGAWLTMFGVVSLALAGLVVFGPNLVFLLKNPGDPYKNLFTSIKWTSVFGWLATVIGGLFAGNSSKTGDRSSPQSVPLALLAKAAGFVFIVGFALAAATTLFLFLMIQYDLTLKFGYWNILNRVHADLLWKVLGVTAGCGFLFSWFFDINIFGLSRFYQYRIVRCYLGATRWKPGVREPHPFTKFDYKDDLFLSELQGKGPPGAAIAMQYSGPYPIVNCTLNLTGSSDLALNTRHSASFSLTPMYCGCDRPKVGYVETRRQAAPGAPELSFAGGITLGQATAVSGAAASPNMGYDTSPLVAFLLTMFNVRLGWWFPNPAKSSWAVHGLRGSLWYLAQELLGIADETSRFLNISDGGHFENLGIYELMQFGGLGNVLRICGTDFGAQIDLDVRSIRTQKEGHSLAHSAVGKIKYDNGSIGYLIYLKASVTGDEDASITQYRAQHTTFPHESTGNQFFTEAQFESYRKLGRHVVKQSFRGTQLGEQPFEVAERLYDQLAPAGCASQRVLAHTQTLERLWQEFRGSPALGRFFKELTPGLTPATLAFTLSVEERSMGLEMIQLMEEVFLDVQLDDFWDHPDNRGWAILFMRWARSPRFQQIWKEARRTFGIRFEYFCASRLGLERDQLIVRV
jgi:hypothetical protein